MSEIIEAEVVDEQPGTAVEPVAAGGLGLYDTDDPEQIIVKASAQAKALDSVVRTQGYYVRIGQGEHLRVEGWQTLGALVGVFPVTAWTKEILDDDGRLVGFRARVEAMRNGEVVGAAESRCMRAERNWSNRDDFALESMAQTRATSKALAQPLRFIVSLAGYSGTPAEEMPRDDYDSGPPPQERRRRPTSDQARARNNGPSQNRGTAAGGRKGPSEAQGKMIFAIANQIGLDTDEDRYAFYSAVVNRPIGSTTELVGGRDGEVSQVIDALKAVQKGEASLGFSETGPYPDYGPLGESGVPPEEEPF